MTKSREVLFIHEADPSLGLSRSGICERVARWPTAPSP